MNFLSHYAFNHRVCGVAESADFALGVALPDLWRRYSSKHRIRWKCVERALVATRADADVRDGLLNHAEADRLFHSLPTFVRWERELREAHRGGSTHPAVLDFACHVVIELSLDRRLLDERPSLAEDFYATIESADRRFLDERLEPIVGVPTSGLHAVVDLFLERRFLTLYREPKSLLAVVQRLLTVLNLRDAIARETLESLIAAAHALCDPQRVWAEMPRPGAAHAADARKAG